MFETNFTNEAINIFQYIKDELIKEYPTNKITIEYFLLSLLENEDSIAYQILSRTTLTSTLNTIHDWFVQTLSKASKLQTSDNVAYDTIFDRCIEMAKKEDIPIISVHPLLLFS